VFINFLLLFFNLNLFAQTEVSIGTIMVDKDSFHFPTATILEGQYIGYGLLNSKWTLDFSPYVESIPDTGEIIYDSTLSVYRYFPKSQLNVELGRFPMWIFDINFSTTGLKLTKAFNKYIEIETDVAYLQKMDKTSLENIGGYAKLGLTYNISKLSNNLSVLYFDKNIGAETTLKGDFNLFSYRLNYKTLKNVGNGFVNTLFIDKSYISYQKDINLNIFNEDESIFETFKTQQDAYITTHLNQLKRWLVLDYKFNSQNQNYNMLKASVQKFKLVPYCAKVNSFGKYTLCGLNYNLFNQAIDFHKGILTSVKRNNKEESFYGGSLSGSFFLYKKNRLTYQFRYFKNSWVQNDLVASIYYQHLLY